MNAGRELDFIIAEKIMGWIRVPVKDFTNVDRFIYVKEDYILCTEAWKNSVMGWNEPKEGMKMAKAPIVPSFSTDISAAWAVVEKLNLFEVRQLFKDFNDTWVIGDYEQYLGNQNIGIRGESASHAICLAAFILFNKL